MDEHTKKRLIALLVLVVIGIIVFIVYYFTGSKDTSDVVPIPPPTVEEIKTGMENLKVATSTFSSLPPAKQQSALANLRSTTTVVNESALSKLRKQ